MSRSPAGEAVPSNQGQMWIKVQGCEHGTEQHDEVVRRCDAKNLSIEHCDGVDERRTND